MSETSNPFREGLANVATADPCVIILFGSRGDLAQRKIIPAISHLAHHGLLPPSFALLGVGRDEISDDAFRDECRNAVEAGGGNEPKADVIDALVRSFHYERFVAGDPDSAKNVASRLAAIDPSFGTAGNRLFYLSTPPSAFAPIIARLGELRRIEGKRGHQRVIIEKPFGRDLASARELNRVVLSVFDESEVYRIDHYLGKETVQNMLVLRFANAIFEPLWNHRYIEHVQITVAESLGVEGRGGYYEESGALRDMIQNHLMQLLCLVAMEPPAALDAEAIRDERRKVLRSIRPITRDLVPLLAVRGQYGPGSIEGRAVPGYREEERVRPHSTTETYAALALDIDNWRWSGVPFFLRTGKRMPKKVSEVAIRFKDIPHRLFEADAGDHFSGNVLALRIQPDEGIALRFSSKVPGFAIRVRPVKMDFQYGTSFGSDLPEAYERLLLDALLGDPTLFIRGDVVDDAWKLVEPILEVWGNTEPDFPNYAAGSFGPRESDELLETEGCAWRRL